MATIDSIDGLIASAMSKNTRPVMFVGFTTATTTAATVDSGLITIQRCPTAYTTGSYGTGVTNAFCFVQALTENQAQVMAAIEYSLGTLTVATNTFGAGVSMGTKSIRVQGTSYAETLASIYPVVNITTTLTATTPTLTITYTNQAGTGSRTCTMVIPTNSIANSCFCMVPHLQSGDTGVRSVENISISSGTAGALRILGLLPIYHCLQSGAGTTTPMTDLQSLSSPFPIYPVASGETIGFYMFATNGATEYIAVMNLIADVPA